MVGSKRRIMDQIWPHLPRGRRIVVPFFGSGSDSMFFHARGLDVLAADANKYLVDLVNNIEDAHARAPTPGDYYAIRERFNAERDLADFLTLLRTSFNGLCRFNRCGEFNVPGPKGPYRPPRNVESFARMVEAIGGVACLDFEETLSLVRPGDVVYVDPPYFGTFDAYLGQPFDHERLFVCLRKLSVPWAMSNSTKRDWSDLGRVVQIYRPGNVNSRGSDRGRVREVLVVHEGFSW